MAETQWETYVSNLEKGRIIILNNNITIAPVARQSGTVYIVRCGCNVLLSTDNLDRVKRAVFY